MGCEQLVWRLRRPGRYKAVCQMWLARESDPVALPPFAWQVHQSSRPIPQCAPFCGSRDGSIPFVVESEMACFWQDTSLVMMRRYQRACTGRRCIVAQQLFQLTVMINLCSSVSPPPKELGQE